jgi:hypothetical protein
MNKEIEEIKKGESWRRGYQAAMFECRNSDNKLLTELLEELEKLITKSVFSATNEWNNEVVISKSDIKAIIESRITK